MVASITRGGSRGTMHESGKPETARVWENGVVSYDILSRLLGERIVFVGAEIDQKLADVVIAQLLFLQSQNKGADIHLYVNSPGGSVTASLAIYDTMQSLKCPVATYAIGQAAGT